ncbi:MAG: FAD-dependent oxidoreductase, partial [Synechococcaceae bacterium WB9_2_170]|nr:FAD-dependent oxidoreductase [Synechococcaceae bacterium WB9_2_170]
NPCGKVIVPPRADLDPQLDVLAERGRANGATVELWDAQQLQALIPEARTASGRALWSPNTAVVKPIKVVEQLQRELQQQGVRFVQGQLGWSIKPQQQQLKLSDGSTLSYGHLFNCAGLQAELAATTACCRSRGCTGS